MGVGARQGDQAHNRDGHENQTTPHFDTPLTREKRHSYTRFVARSLFHFRHPRHGGLDAVIRLTSGFLVKVTFASIGPWFFPVLAFHRIASFFFERLAVKRAMSRVPFDQRVRSNAVVPVSN